MDENQIAAQLAGNIPPELRDAPTPAPKPEPPNTAISHNPVQIDDPVLSQRLSDYFELDRIEKYTEKAQLQLRTVLEWAGEQATEHADIMLIIARAERELGIQMKPNKLGLLYKFIKLERASENIQKELELITYGAE